MVFANHLPSMSAGNDDQDMHQVAFLGTAALLHGVSLCLEGRVRAAIARDT